MRVIIIGGIAAGMSAAAKAKRVNKDAEIIVIEKENYISFGACGLPYYIGEQFENPDNMFARTPEQIEDSGIDLLLQHEVKTVDFANKIVNFTDLTTKEEKNLSYDRLMIATGATPTFPPIRGLQAKNSYTITRLSETQKFKDELPKYQKIGIIGGGFIGLEMAEQLASLGKEVYIFEREAHVLDKVYDAEIVAKIEEALIAEKINLHVSESVESVDNDLDTVKTIVTDKSSYPVDAVIVAVGFRPNTHIFTDPMLKKLENGAIIIDKFGRTSVPDVFSGGDCATVPFGMFGDTYLPLATSANKLGRIIGTNIVSNMENYEAYPGSLKSSQIKIGQYEAGGTGITEKQAKDFRLNYKTVTVEANNHSNYYPNQNKVMIKLIYEADTLKIIGGQVFGRDGAVLRLTALTTAVYAGLTTKELGFIDYAYSPPFSSTWDALNVAGNAAK